jgi:hypothetical protein
MSKNAPESVTIRTIISHSNVRHYLLQYSLPLRELLVPRLCSLELLAELLETSCVLRGAMGTYYYTYLDFSALKELGILAHCSTIGPRSDYSKRRGIVRSHAAARNVHPRLA